MTEKHGATPSSVDSTTVMGNVEGRTSHYLWVSAHSPFWTGSDCELPKLAAPSVGKLISFWLAGSAQRRHNRSCIPFDEPTRINASGGAWHF